MVYAYNELLFSNKKERTIDPPINIGESQNNYADWKAQTKKEYILYDSIYMKFWKIQTNL